MLSCEVTKFIRTPLFTEDLRWLLFCLFLKRKFPYDSATKASNFSIYFAKSALKSHSIQEKRTSSTVSSEINRADKITLLDICIVAMQRKVKSHMVLST